MGEVFSIGDGQRAHGIEFSADGARVLTRAGDSVVKAWTIKSDAVPLVLDQGQRIEDAIFDPTGKLVLIRSQELAVLWQATNGRKLWPLAHPEAIHHARFSQDGRFVITQVDTGRDGDRSFVSVWDTESGRKRFEARLGAGSFRWSLGTSGRTLLLWNESQIQGWALETGLTLFSEPLVLRKPLLRERPSKIEFVHFSQDDGLLVTATSLEGVILKIGGDRLRPILDEVTTLCLSPGFRQANLGESHTVAEAIHGQCVNR